MSVHVELPVDVVDRSEGPSSRGRRFAPVAALVLVAFVWLLLTDQPTDPVAQEPPADVSSQSSAVEDMPLGWPARGSLADDSAALADAEAAWRRDAATARGWDSPGLDLNTIWAGEIDGRAYAILESRDRGDVGLVASLSAPLSQTGRLDWSVDEVMRVDSEPPFVVLTASGDKTASDRVRIVPDPSLLEEGVQFYRVVDGRYESIAIRPDGASEETGLSSGSAAEVVGLREFGPRSTLISASRVSSMHTIPGDGAVRFVRPLWGRAGATTAADYLDALAALEATGRSSAWVFVAGSSSDEGRRVSLVAVWPFYEGWPDVVTVTTAADGQRVSPPRDTAFEQQVVGGRVRVDDSTEVVVAAASPQATRVAILLDGELAGEGTDVASVFVPATTGAQVAAEAYQADGTVLAREVLTPDLE